MKKTFIFSKWVVASALSLGFASTTLPVYAQSANAIVCPNYKVGTNNAIGQRAGKKVQKAYEAYSDEKNVPDDDQRVKNALAILLDIDPKGAYDKAYVDKFIGQLYAATDPAKGLKYLKQATDANVLNDSEQAASLRTVADLELMNRNYTDAVKAYQKWMKFTCQENPEVYTRIANAYYQAKEYDKVIAPAKKAAKLNLAAGKPKKEPYQMELASYYEHKKYHDAVGVAEELVRLFPDNKQWWTQLAQFYMAVEDYKKALATLQIAYDNGYLDKESQIKVLAQLYANNDIPYKAAVLLEKHLKSGLVKANKQVFSSLASNFQQAKNIKKAAYYYGKAADISGDTDLYRKQGTLLLSAEDYKGALVALKKSLKGAEQPGRIHMAMMQAYFYEGDYKEAYAQVEMAMKHSSTMRNAKAWAPYIKEKARNHGVKI